MRFSTENQPSKRRYTEEKKEVMSASVKPSTKAYFKGKRGEAGRVLDEYVESKKEK